MTITKDRRERIAEIADRYGVLLIEDDVFGPLKDDKPAPIAETASHCTVYITSLSKTVALDLRVGFLKAPEALTSALHQSVNLSVWMTPPTSLEVARQMIDDGIASQPTNQQQRIAVGRQVLALEALGETFAGPAPDGFHLWVPLPEGWRADVFTAECRREGAVLSEARGFAMNATDALEAIRICLSHEASEERLQEGLDMVGCLLHQKPISSPLSM